MYQNTIDYFIALDVLGSKLMLITLLVVSCAYYFVLRKFVYSFLHDTKENLPRIEKKARFNIVLKTKAYLTLGESLGIITMIFLFSHWFFGCTNAQTYLCDTFILLIPIFFTIHILSLIILQFNLGYNTFDLEKRKFQESLEIIEAVISFKSGKRISGGVIDLNILTGAPYLRLRLSNGHLHFINVNQISKIFLQKNYIDEPALDLGNFVRGPKLFTLNDGSSEIFEYSKYYDVSQFRIIRTIKRDSNTKFIIALKSELETA